MALTDTDRQILDFEAGWWTRPGPKAGGIRAAVGLSPTAFYRRLDALAARADAFAYAPLVVQRIRRRQSQRRRVRFEGAVAPHDRLR